ncbi:MAG TPA: hypothetical protein VG476_10195, partial [Acidimicrobiales bacterium]|nr:hypothetical protein [Acidimicrobiales bacterium]
LVLGTAGATVALFPASASASAPNFLGGGGKAGPLTFSFGVTSDVTGNNVKGAFTLADSEGRFTVQATCLQVSPGNGGLMAGTGGKVIASTEPFAPPGTGILVGASNAPDELALLEHLPTGDVPGPGQCAPSFVPGDAVALTHGNIVIRQGS